AKPARRSPRRKLMRLPLPAVEVDDHGDRAPAHGAEGNLVPGEHDAVFLRAVVTRRFVERALEGAHLSGVRVGPEEFRLEDLLLAEERVDLVLRAVVRAELPALLLRLPRGLLELGLLPRRRQRRAGRDEVLPLQGLRIVH